MTESLKKLEHVSYNVLKHFVLHLVRVAEEEGNKMNCRNLVINKLNLFLFSLGTL